MERTQQACLQFAGLAMLRASMMVKPVLGAYRLEDLHRRHSSEFEADWCDFSLWQHLRNG
ncbi:MAG: hypothetical protein A2064_02160 [Spirochaetes bacterium GWB1_66_5]|nr:MAG: hypothetical protein A2064_02160 [Spirochaetes bacterium GWB1_66_5]